MTTHTHPEILEEIQAIDTHIAATEDRLRADMYKIKDELKSDIAGLGARVGGLETSVGGLSARMGSLGSDVKAIKDFLLPPTP